MGLVIVGASGFSLEAACLGIDCGYDLIGFLDDDSSKRNTQVLGKPVLGGVDQWSEYKQHEFVIAIGSPRRRYEVLKRMTKFSRPKFATLVHPSVKASEYISIGEGSLICAGCILTVHINIGCHCIININSTVGHETVVGSFSTVAPIVAISGNVKIDELVEVGTSASIKQGLTLGRGSMLGMGSVLTKNTMPNNVYAGVPAKPLKKLEAI